MTPEEQSIIAYLAECFGRPLTPQEVHLSLAQARQVGELPYDAAEGCGYREARNGAGVRSVYSPDVA